MLVPALRIASAVLLLVIGGIHLFLVLDGVGGVLGLLFVLNAIAGIALAAAVSTLRGRLLLAAAGAGFLFAAASLAALLLALTVGLFGLREVWTFTLVPQTVVVDAVAVVVLAATTAVLARAATAVPRAAEASPERLSGRR